MIVKFFRHGQSNSKASLDYFLGKERNREHAKILSGDENEVAQLIDSSPYLKKYTSGCLSFYEHDLSDQDKTQIMQDFEACLFPGLDRDQYRVLWIEHKDKINEETKKRRLELNFLIPNTEILSGKRLQPFYYKSDLKRVDLFKKITNHEYKLHDPDDPVNRLATNSKDQLPKSQKELKEVINKVVEKAVSQNVVKDRATLKDFLEKMQFKITRQTAKSISVKHINSADNSKPIRLKGAIYEQDFRIGRASREATQRRAEEYQRESETRHERNLKEYSELIEYKCCENRKRYRKCESANTQENRVEQQANIRSLEQVQRLEQSNFRASKNQENTSCIELYADFTNLYSHYMQHLFHVSNQQKIRELKNLEATRTRANIENERISRSIENDTKAVFRQISDFKREIDESNANARRAIEHYKQTAPAIGETTATTARATEAVRQKLLSVTRLDYDNANARRVQQNLDRAKDDDERAYFDLRETTRANRIESYFIKNNEVIGRQLAKQFKQADFGVSKNRYKDISQARNISTNDRDQERLDERNASSRAVSSRLESIDSTNIFKAIKLIERREFNENRVVNNITKKNEISKSNQRDNENSM